MADDKKGDKKSGGGGGGDQTLILIGVVVAIFLVYRGYLFLITFIQTRGYVSSSESVNSVTSNIYYGIQSFVLYFNIFSNILSVLFLMGIIYTYIRVRELTVAENRRLQLAAEGSVTEENGRSDENKRWEEIVEHIQSDNPAGWRLAIIEADVILDELLDKIGCVGPTIGDKLKQVQKADFKTLDSAWEAHKVRNMIAHEGTGFQLTNREAKRVISLYEQVFKEFHFI